jgi:hypothetical protein
MTMIDFSDLPPYQGGHPCRDDEKPCRLLGRTIDRKAPESEPHGAGDDMRLAQVNSHRQKKWSCHGVCADMSVNVEQAVVLGITIPHVPAPLS